jgi:hypothetical protein
MMYTLRSVDLLFTEEEQREGVCVFDGMNNSQLVTKTATYNRADQ